MEKSKQVNRFQIVNTVKEDPYITISGAAYNYSAGVDWWKFGQDNLFPQAVALLNRKAAVHRGILRNKARYCSGAGYSTSDERTSLYLSNCNNQGESLKDVTRKVVFDYFSFGNAYLELVTNPKHSFLNLYHQDATKCRLKKDKTAILLHHDWITAIGTKEKIKEIPIYPVWGDSGDGCLRSIIHFKDYEPGYENYGIMDWVAGLAVSAIAYKTDKWNISRLDNSFKGSGVLNVVGEFETPEEISEFKEEFKENFTGEGTTGKVLMVMQSPGQEAANKTTFTSTDSNTEGDWKELHLQSSSDLVVAHSWFRSLSGIADNTGFDTKRILNEYEIALRTIIQDTQEVFLGWYQSIIGEILGYDTSDLAFINKPPVTDKPGYMMIWEARKADGLDYDEEDPEQKIYLANIGTKTLTLQ